MGLSTNLADVASESIPIIILISAVKGVSYIRYLVLCLVHSVAGAASGQSPPPSDPSSSSVDSNLAGLVFVADHFAANPSFEYGRRDPRRNCVFCLEGLREGERVRRLPCCHVFHGECVERWMVGHGRVTCPVCRSPAVAADEAADWRIGAELVAWLSPY